MKLKVNEFDSYRPPARLPWLPVLIVAIGIALIVYRRDGTDSKHTDTQETSVRAESKKAKKGDVVQKSLSAEDESLSQIPVNVADLLTKADALALIDPPAPEPLQEARQIYENLLEQPVRASVRKRIEGSLGNLNVRLTLSPLAMPEKVMYVVKSGDSVDRIAKRFGTTVELVQRSNIIRNANLIRQGDNFLVLNGKFRVEVSKSKCETVVFLNDKFFKRYPVGTGKFGRTPVGTFEIAERIKEPTWWRPDGKEIAFGHPENILGTRWMEIRATGDTPNVKGYGIHGTWLPDSIGKAESAGCIRMLNEDVEELFSLLPLHTLVNITE